MASFDKIVKKVLDIEGGYQKWYNDRGNWTGGKIGKGQLVGTNHGISTFSYIDYYHRIPTVQDMLNITEADAYQIFKVLKWDKIQGDAIQNQAVADIFLDGVVNHGHGVKLMQEVLGIAQDGVVGMKTLQAINAANPQSLYNAYKERRRVYYHQLVQADSRNQEFLEGWLQRLDKFKDYAEEKSSEIVGIVVGIALLFFCLV
jgi:lysozyme family protein